MFPIIWKPVVGYESSYLVSNTGEVRSRNRLVRDINHINRRLLERSLKPRVDRSGYVTVRLNKEDKSKTCFVHRLVAEAFIPNPANLPEVNHKSGVKTDNTPANLEWVSHSENVKHAYRVGLNRNQKGNHAFAVGVIDNQIGKEFATIKEWCEARGVKYSTGRNILSGCNRSKEIDSTLIVRVNKMNYGRTV